MSDCEHRWTMTDIEFGFIAFERCFHCNRVRAFFSRELHPDKGDEYREGSCFWERVENAQSFMFNLKCKRCGSVVNFNDLMGLMNCTGCMTDCDVDKMRRECREQRTWTAVAFGFLPNTSPQTLSPSKLGVLSDYFNQQRDTTRSRVRVLSSSLIPDVSRCRGDFIHDVGMLSPEPATGRKPLL